MARPAQVIAMGSAMVWTSVAVWAAMGVYVSITDLREGLIPRRVVWPAGVAVALLLGASSLVAGDLVRFALAAAAAACIAVLLEVCFRLWPDQMGFGDVRLIIVNSLLAGWWGPVWALWALMAGALAGWPVAVWVLVRRGRDSRIRWAPGLVAGAAAVIGWRLWAEGPLR